MGVLSCSRRGCTNIMCDRYSRNHGYLCDGCFSELVRRMTYTDITINEFLSTNKRDGYKSPEQTVYNTLNGIFLQNNGDG